MPKKLTFHVISNTHWDREWRYPFQRNRQTLVEMIDNVIQILETYPEYRAFHLDSQTIVLKDYLEIRPNREARLKKLISERRLFVGPWYILPDEFLVSGESLIRNLLLGHQIATQFGHVMKIGYSPFSWGQISQMPQLYAGFGIDVIMFYRGVNSMDSPKSEFIWEGADGTKALTSRFSTMPRYNFFFYIYRPVVHNEQIPDVEYRWEKGGAPFHFADRELKDEDYALIKPLDEYHRENLKPAVEAIIREQVQDFTTSHIFWAEGHDTSGPNAKTVQIIKDINQFIKEGEVVHSTLEDYAVGLKDEVDYKWLKLVQGERRSAQYDHNSGNLYGYVTSARMYLKQAQFEAERWLQFYAEPFNVLAELAGLDIQDEYLNRAWDLLLQNTAHDCIGGCSLDAIHDDMQSRYKQIREIAIGVFDRACKKLVGHLALPSAINLVWVNPLPYVRDDIREVSIDIPHSSDLGGIQLENPAGEAIPFQLINNQPVKPVLEQLIDRPMYFDMQRYHLYVEIRQLPAMGLHTIIVKPITAREIEIPSKIGSLEHNLPILENEYLRVQINSNGTLNVLDKENQKNFNEIGYFYDEGEAGHAWVHQKVKPVFSTLYSEPEIILHENGPLVARCLVRHRFMVPRTLTARQNKLWDTVIVPIEMSVILKKGSQIVEFELTLNNQAECHRLRMMFPTRLANAKFSWAEGQFDVTKRLLARPDTSNWVEQPMVDYPLYHFVDVSEEKNGAALLVNGLKEYEVLDDEKQTIALTLLRAFNYSIPVSSLQDYSYQKGSQCLGSHHYKLAFYPHRGDWKQGQVYQEALQFNYPLRAIQLGRSNGTWQPETTFLRIQPDDLIFSCLKETQQRTRYQYILRLYNPGSEPLTGNVWVLFPMEKTELVTLEEIHLESIPIDSENSLQIQVDPKKIVTLRITFKPDNNS
jgi:hypothetical protein